MKYTLILLLLLTSCTKIYNEYPEQSLTAPTPVTTDKIEFRVLGTNLVLGSIVTIRHIDSNNGVTLYSGSVPYYASLSSKDDFIFLFLEASGIGASLGSTLQVQIFVNGKLFREGFSQGLILSTQTSGTYRR